MKRTIVLVACLAVLLLAGATYVASPFYAAWTLREAIKTADTPTITRKVDFDAIRVTLRKSLAEHAQLAGIAEEAGRAVRPSLWQRMKSAFGATMIDRFIETYVTPEGLPRLYQVKASWNETVRGKPSLDGLPWRERLQLYFSRLKRAEFLALGHVEIEMADEHNPERHFVSNLELIGFEWKLVALRVVKAGSTAASRLLASN